MALTKARHAALVRMAGESLLWECGVSTARLSSDPRSGLMHYLTAKQDGRCAFCGDKSDNLETCHIVPGGRKRLGWVEGNLAMGCRECNEIDGDDIIRFETIKRPDLIVAEWPDIPYLTLVGRQIKFGNERRKTLKRMRRGMA